MICPRCEKLWQLVFGRDVELLMLGSSRKMRADPSTVCVPHIQPFFLPVDIRHNANSSNLERYLVQAMLITKLRQRDYIVIRASSKQGRKCDAVSSYWIRQARQTHSIKERKSKDTRNTYINRKTCGTCRQVNCTHHLLYLSSSNRRWCFFTPRTSLFCSERAKKRKMNVWFSLYHHGGVLVFVCFDRPPVGPAQSPPVSPGILAYLCFFLTMTNISCEIKDFVKDLLCKLCGKPIARTGVL